MKVLNLYSGLGGNRRLWKNIDVTAVENNGQIAAVYKKHFPNDKIVIGDAHIFLLDNYHKYDLIWSSPPCQSHSKMMFTTHGRYGTRKFPDMKLYEEILWLRHFCKGKWVVENVQPYYSPLIKPDAVLGRHCFWANFPIASYEPPVLDNFIRARTAEVQEWLGLDLGSPLKSGNGFRPDQALRNCVHPKLGLHVLEQAQNSKLKKDAFISKNLLKARAIELKQKQYETNNSI